MKKEALIASFFVNKQFGVYLNVAFMANYSIFNQNIIARIKI